MLRDNKMFINDYDARKHAADGHKAARSNDQIAFETQC